MVLDVLMAVRTTDTHTMKRRVVGVAAAAVAIVAAMSSSGCSLSNISVDACTSNAECESVFGLGSVCGDGFCSAPASCKTGHDCRASFGGGACVDSICSNTAPPGPDDFCTITEPSNLLTRSLSSDDTPFTIVGSMFRLDDSSDLRVSLGAQLAMREIQEVSGLNEGGGIGMMFCNSADSVPLDDQQRIDRIHAVIDYLAGTLGVPFIVGPGTSTDALDAINYIVNKQYPTVLISPSATSPALTSEPDRLAPGDEHGLFWRTAPSDQLQGVLLASNVVGVFPTPSPVAKVAVVYVNDAYGEGLANVFQNAWLETNTNTARLIPFDNDDNNDWGAIAADVDGFAPDAIVMVAITANRTVKFIAEMAALPGLQTLPLYLTDGSKDAEILLNAGLDATVRSIIFNQVVGTAPAGPDPTSAAFNLFRGNYDSAFDEDPTGFAFVANAYDAAYVGAAGIVFAAQDGTAYDGRDVAAGMARLVGGANTVEVAKSQWSAIKSGMTSGEKAIDIVGISGALDFDPALGEAAAPIEVWQPTESAADCATGSPCFQEIARVDPPADM